MDTQKLYNLPNLIIKPWFKVQPQKLALCSNTHISLSDYCPTSNRNYWTTQCTYTQLCDYVEEHSNSHNSLNILPTLWSMLCYVDCYCVSCAPAATWQLAVGLQSSSHLYGPMAAGALVVLIILLINAAILLRGCNVNRTKSIWDTWTWQRAASKEREKAARALDDVARAALL